MNSNKFKIQLLFIITFFFCIIHAQTKPVEHIVSKGDNIYRLSLRYEVSIESIYKLNPGSQIVIKVGDTLRIPSNTKSISTENNSTSRKHYVSKGETKYGLSKRYNISIAQLEKANPSIIAMLIAGQTIDIPSATNNDQITKSSPSTNGFHTVKKGETLWSISQKYNMSVDDLKVLNQDRLNDFLSIGQTLLLRPDNTVVDQEAYTVIKGDTKYGLSKRFNLTVEELERLNPQIKLMLMAGAKIIIRDIESDKNISNTSKTVITKTENHQVPKNTEDDLEVEKNNTSYAADVNKLLVLWDDNFTFNDLELNEKKAKYFKGLKLAIDSIKKEYPEHHINITEKSENANTILNASDKKTFLFPFDNSSASQNTIESLDLFSIVYQNEDGDKKLFLKGLPSIKDMRTSVLNYLKTKKGHIICLYDDENFKNKNSIETALTNVDFIKISEKGFFDSENLTNSLNKRKKNFVIIESSEVGVFLTCTNILLKNMATYDIQLVVLNSENIPSKEKITYKRFKILNLLYPKQYKVELNKDMDDTVALSFAINYDAFKRLYKNQFEAFSNNNKTSFLGFNFNYQQHNNMFENKAVPLFIFDENSNHTLIFQDY